MRILDRSIVVDILDIPNVIDRVEEALLAQAAGTVERPHRPHFPIGAGVDGDTALGMGLTMPAYIHGYPYYSTKLASYHEDNPARGYPTLRAQILLTDVRTGEPLALLAGTRVTNVRTGCIGGLVARELASEPVRLGVLGAGRQARWQTRAIAHTRTVESVSIYSPSESRRECAQTLRGEGIQATAVETPAAAVEEATVVVTATTSTEPVFPPNALSEAVEVIFAVGSYTAELQELAPSVVEGARRLYADVPAEAIETGDFIHTTISEPDLESFGALLAGKTTPPQSGYAVVSSVGTAVLDLAAGAVVYERARDEQRGQTIDLGE